MSCLRVAALPTRTTRPAYPIRWHRREYSAGLVLVLVLVCLCLRVCGCASAGPAAATAPVVDNPRPRLRGHVCLPCSAFGTDRMPFPRRGEVCRGAVDVCRPLAPGTPAPPFEPLAPFVSLKRHLLSLRAPPVELPVPFHLTPSALARSAFPWGCEPPSAPQGAQYACGLL